MLLTIISTSIGSFIGVGLTIVLHEYWSAKQYEKQVEEQRKRIQDVFDSLAAKGLNGTELN